jgi:hypothetical protein
MVQIRQEIAPGAVQTPRDGPYDVHSTSFSLSSSVLAPGTYWPTLTNGTASDGGPIAWDQNSGSSTA